MHACWLGVNPHEPSPRRTSHVRLSHVRLSPALVAQRWEGSKRSVPNRGPQEEGTDTPLRIEEGGQRQASTHFQTHRCGRNRAPGPGTRQHGNNQAPVSRSDSSDQQQQHRGFSTGLGPRSCTPALGMGIALNSPHGQGRRLAVVCEENGLPLAPAPVGCKAATTRCGIPVGWLARAAAGCFYAHSPKTHNSS